MTVHTDLESANAEIAQLSHWNCEIRYERELYKLSLVNVLNAIKATAPQLEDHFHVKMARLVFALSDTKPLAQAFDLVTHLRRQIEFSARTYGPGARTAGVCDHIRKELREVEDDAAAGKPTLSEWVDVIILAFDGGWRSGATPEEIVSAIVAKQTKNEGRKWPDWRTTAPGKAIEHDRSADAA